VFIVIKDYIKVYLKFAKEWCFATVCVSQDIQRQYWLDNLIFNNWNKCILVDRYICISIYIYISRFYIHIHSQNWNALHEYFCLTLVFSR